MTATATATWSKPPLSMECAAVLDALLVLKLVDENIHHRGCDLLARIVAMLTKLCR